MTIARLLLADLVAPVDQAPIPHGFVAIDGRGRISAVGRQADLPADRWGLPETRYPDSVILPGLINLHTHLEFTHLPPSCGPLHGWILDLIRITRVWTPEHRLSSAITGARACLVAGITCIADLSPTGASLHAATAVGLRGIFYQEAFGLDDGHNALTRLHAHLAGLAPLTSPERRLGLAPHSPYTVSFDLWAGLVELAKREGLPLSTHLAESPAEIAWFAGQPSDIPEFHANLGLPAYQPPQGHPITLLAEHGLLTPDLLAAHCVHAGPAERRLLRDHQVVAVTCPRSNVCLQVGNAPVDAWEQEGLRWGVGTDSAASASDLHLRQDLQSPVLQALPFNADDWLRRLTLESARHLGWADEIGSLSPGKAADLIVVRPPIGTVPSVATALSPTARVLAAYVGGIDRL